MILTKARRRKKMLTGASFALYYIYYLRHLLLLVFGTLLSSGGPSKNVCFQFTKEKHYLLVDITFVYNEIIENSKVIKI